MTQEGVHRANHSHTIDTSPLPTPCRQPTLLFSGLSFLYFHWKRQGDVGMLSYFSLFIYFFYQEVAYTYYPFHFASLGKKVIISSGNHSILVHINLHHSFSELHSIPTQVGSIDYSTSLSILVLLGSFQIDVLKTQRTLQQATCCLKCIFRISATLKFRVKPCIYYLFDIAKFCMDCTTWHS